MGGFKRSSQHLDWSWDEHSETALGSFWAGALVLTRSTAGGRTRGAAAILAAIAAGTASEDAAVGVGVPQAVGTRWFRKAGGMPPSMFGLSAKPLSGRYLSCAARGGRAPSHSGLLHAGGRPPARAGGIDNLPRAAAQRRHPKRRPRVSCDDSAVARRARCSPPKAGEACAQRGVKNLCRGTVGWRRRGSERGSSSPPGRVLEKPSARTVEGPAMGKRLEPGADRPSPAGGLPGRRDHAHQP